MHLDFDELSSSDEDLSKKKQREKRIRQEMAEHKSASRTMNTFENRYNAQMKMLKEQNRLLKGFDVFQLLHVSFCKFEFVDQQRMIEELKYQQDQQVMHHQLSNLEALKAQQVQNGRFRHTEFHRLLQNEMEEKQRKQLITDRRHATALIQAHNRGELQKQLHTTRSEYVRTAHLNLPYRYFAETK